MAGFIRLQGFHLQAEHKLLRYGPCFCAGELTLRNALPEFQGRVWKRWNREPYKVCFPCCTYKMQRSEQPKLRIFPFLRSFIHQAVLAPGGFIENYISHDAELIH